jgi:hypothetical protein
MNWLEGVSPIEAAKVSTILGISPQLLSIISSVTLLPTSPNRSNKLMYAQSQEMQIQNLKQWSPEQEGPEKEVLLATAEAFRLATLIYLRCHVHGYAF